MKTISKNSNQLPGIIALFAVPTANILRITGTRIFLSDPDWFYKFDCAAESIQRTIVRKESKAGRYYQVQLSAFIPGQNTTVENTLTECDNLKFVIVYQDTDGTFMRIGSKSVGLPLFYTHQTNENIGYNIAFEGNIKSPEAPCQPLYVIPVVAPKDYGCLYNIYAAMNIRGIAPAGYRIAMDTDWQTLILFIQPDADGNNNVVGTKLKSCWQLNAPYPCGRQNHPRWDESHLQGSDDYGFSALPAGALFAQPKDIPKNESQAEKYEPYTPYKYQQKFYGEKAMFFSAITNPPIGETRIYNREAMYNREAFERILMIEPNDLINIRCIKTDPTDWQPGDTVTDIDGNIYNTIKIGDQVWMAANLKVKTYNNGEPIPNVSQMTSDQQGAYAIIV